MKKGQIFLGLLIGIILCIGIGLAFSFNGIFKDIYYKFSCNFQNQENILQKVGDINKNIGNFKVIEKNIPGVPSEGTDIKLYYDKNTNELVLVEVSSFAAIARYFTKYYLRNGNIYFIDSVTDEWDLQKLYGKNGELSSSEGEYVVGTSTKEHYVIMHNKLCKYIAEKPRVESVAVTKSDPEKDVKGLFEMYQFVLDEIK